MNTTNQKDPESSNSANTENSEKITLNLLLKNKKLIVILGLTLVLVISITALATWMLTRPKLVNLESIALIDLNLQRTDSLLTENVQRRYSMIEIKAAEQPNKYAKLKEEAKKFQKISNKFYNEIDEIKNLIIQHAGGADSNYKWKLKYTSNMFAATEVFENDGNAEALNGMINSYRKTLLYIIGEDYFSIYSDIERKFTLMDADGNNCGVEVFYKDIPSAASLALLSKLQVDIRIAEADMLDFMLQYIENLDLRITSLNALVVAPNSIVEYGGTYSAKICLGAGDRTMRPTIYYTNQAPFYDSIVEDRDVRYKLLKGVQYDTLALDDSGNGVIRVACNSLGVFNYGGLIHYVSNRGDMWMPFNSSYQVGR